MDRITYCIPSKNNLRYLKTCIPSIRLNAANGSHDIIVYVDEDTDGTREWLDNVKEMYALDVIVNPNLGKSLRGIGNAYDDCVRASKTDVFTIFHADMILGKNADLHALDHLTEGTVVASTRVEPPNYPNAGEKIQKQFGQYPEDFLDEKFNEFVEENTNTGKTTEGIFAPWMMYKKDFLALGGHDPRMHSCREDSDVFNRMQLAGYKFVQVWDSLVWHFGGRGAGSNTNFDTEEDRIRHEEWKKNMSGSTREFIRKWKSNVEHTPLMKPIVNPIYDTAYVVKNCNPNLLAALEPLADDIYIDCDYADYIQEEQYKTVDNLLTKVHPITETPDNQVVVELDGQRLTQQDYQILFKLGAILKQSGKVGKSKLGAFNIEITINALEEKTNNLIHL